MLVLTCSIILGALLFKSGTAVGIRPAPAGVFDINVGLFTCCFGISTFVSGSGFLGSAFLLPLPSHIFTTSQLPLLGAGSGIFSLTINGILKAIPKARHVPA